ncbi:MAG: hypothetical protein AB7F89_21225 [Pirellulaceae bacterium]
MVRRAASERRPLLASEPQHRRIFIPPPGLNVTQRSARTDTVLNFRLGHADESGASSTVVILPRKTTQQPLIHPI